MGLDHVGFHVEDRDRLESWRAHLDDQGVTTSGIVEEPYGLHLSFKDLAMLRTAGVDVGHRGQRFVVHNIALEYFCTPPHARAGDLLHPRTGLPCGASKLAS
jgi:hypothetical protein